MALGVEGDQSTGRHEGGKPGMLLPYFAIYRNLNQNESNVFFVAFAVAGFSAASLNLVDVLVRQNHTFWFAVVACVQVSFPALKAFLISPDTSSKHLFTWA